MRLPASLGGLLFFVSLLDISKMENSSLLAKHADDCDVNEGEVTRDAEDGNGEHLSNSPSCSKDLKS